MKHLFTLLFILTLASSIAQTTSLYDINFTTAEGYSGDEIFDHEDWDSQHKNDGDWRSELNPSGGYVHFYTSWTRLHHQVAVKTTETQNVIQLIVSFKPWNGQDEGNVIANTGKAGSFLAAGLHTLSGAQDLGKGADGINNTADDDHSVEYINVSENSKWKIGGTEVNVLAVNRLGYHLKIEFIIGADVASSTSYAQLQQNDGTAIGSPVNIPNFPDALFNALKSDGNGGYFVLAAQNLNDHVNENDLRLTRVRANLLSTSTLHTQELNDFRFTVYPNPAKDVIRFQSELPLERVEIFSLTGSKVLSQSNNVRQVEVGNLAKGIYMLKASAVDGKVAIQKLIKE